MWAVRLPVFEATGATAPQRHRPLCRMTGLPEPLPCCSRAARCAPESPRRQPWREPMLQTKAQRMRRSSGHSTRAPSKRGLDRAGRCGTATGRHRASGRCTKTSGRPLLLRSAGFGAHEPPAGTRGIVRVLAAALCLVPLLWAGRPVSAQERSPRRPNVLLICVDDLRPELGCFGRAYIRSPHIDALAARGRRFLRHYVQAPTCGASRYTLLTGRYGPYGNGALWQRARQLRKDPASVPPSLPAWFRQNGYTTVSVGKVSHHPGGRGGPDWDDPRELEMPLSWDRHLMPCGPWKHPRGAMHGLANGRIRIRASEMPVFESVQGPDTTYPDGWIAEEALRQLEELGRTGADRPFFLAVGFIRPHLPFGAPARYFEPYRDAVLPPIPHPDKPAGRTTWHGSGEFMKYQRWGRDPRKDPEFADAVRRHYAACVSFADAQVGKLLDRLDRLPAGRDTIVVLWGDHGWHLGEHAIWGKHSLFEESLRAPLIISYRGLPHPGQASAAVVETIDVFPTLCELAGLPVPDFVHGVSLVPQLRDPSAPGHPAVAYTKARTIRTATHRLIEHPDGFIELYDHRSDDGETRNVAAGHPELVKQLRRQLRERLALRSQ